MAEVLFYHLERARLDGVLPGLLEKTLERGWRAVVRIGDPDAVDRIDSLLWTYAEESFLPHGSSGSADDHPVWLTTSSDLPAQADLLFLVCGAEAGVTELAGLTRCIAIFDGDDEAALAQARSLWKAVKGTEHEATYWRQSPEGRWEKQG